MPLDGTNFTPYESARTRNLKAARALIASPDHWTTGVRNDGRGRMCALGALDQVLLGLNGRAFPRLLLDYDKVHDSPEAALLASKATVAYVGGPASRVAAHNNTKGHAATLEMFDGAINASIELDMIEQMAMAA